MSRCACGSYAINIGAHGRVSGKNKDLCDVCYWRAEYARLEQECERLRAGLKGDYDLDAWLDWATEKESLLKQVEGLRSDKDAIDLLNRYIVTADHPETGKTAILADSGTLRDCMEAALSTKP